MRQRAYVGIAKPEGGTAVTKTKRTTLSVGEAARRLDVSPDTVRNYCEREWLHCIRSLGNHRRITLRSIESFEAQRRADEPNPRSTNSSPRALPVVDEELEIYYLGNETYPNSIEAGYVCNASFFGRIWKGVTPSSILMYVAGQFGGGVFRIVRVLDGQAVSERTIQVPGPTKEQEVLITREIALDS